MRPPATTSCSLPPPMVQPPAGGYCRLRQPHRRGRRMQQPGASAAALYRARGARVPYQGTECWDFSLVDPDNRRPVDWSARAASLPRAGDPGPHCCTAGRDRRVKQAVLQRALQLRARQHDLFVAGDHVALTAEGPLASHVFAYARRRGRQMLVTAVTRLPASLLGDRQTPLVPPLNGTEPNSCLPREASGRPWRETCWAGRRMRQCKAA